MKPILQWTEDWEIGIDIPRESEISRQVLELFVEFWSDEGMSSATSASVWKIPTVSYPHLSPSILPT